MSTETGDYSICRVKPQKDSDGLMYDTLSWGYESEEQAIADVRKIANESRVEIEDLAVIKIIMAADLEKQGALPH